MGKKVAPGTGLTPRQEQFLAVVLQEPYLLKHFYLTGGTALACWYLGHRESYDLDFFNEVSEVNAGWINRWFNKRKPTIGYSHIVHTEQFGFHFYQLTYPDGHSLKIDFSFFPSPRIDPGLTWRGLTIDSLYDIAVNKFQTISGSPRLKDYVDLYLILKENRWDIEKLRRDAGVKFGIHVDDIHLARQFLRVNEFTDPPKMLKSFNKQDMEVFFVKLAKSLESEIFS